MPSFTDNDIALLIAVFKRARLSSEDNEAIATELDIKNSLLSCRIGRFRKKIGLNGLRHNQRASKVSASKQNVKATKARVQSQRQNDPEDDSEGEVTQTGVGLRGTGSPLDGEDDSEGGSFQDGGEGGGSIYAKYEVQRSNASRKHKLKVEDMEDEDTHPEFTKKKRSITGGMKRPAKMMGSFGSKGMDGFYGRHKENYSYDFFMDDGDL